MAGIFVGHLRQAARLAGNEIIREMDEEWLIAYRWPGTQNCVPESERLALPNVNAGDAGRHYAANGLQQIILA